MLEFHEPMKKVRIKTEDRKVYVEKTIFDDPVLANNQAHRQNETFRRGDSGLAFLPKEAEVIYVIQAPEPLWNRFKALNKGLYLELHSKNQITREAAAAKLRTMHPEWFIEMPRTFVHLGGIARA